MKIVMVGSGAVGSYFGAKLHQSGHDVVFVARGETLRVLRERGLTLRQNDVETTFAVTATDDLASIGAADYVLIGVKTWQVEPIAPLLPALSAARYLTLQNGVEAAHQIAQHVGVERTLGGLVRGFFELDAPGIVRHVGVRPTIIFGQIGGAPTPEAERLHSLLAEADIYNELLPDIEAALWEKFALVTSLSGVGAVTRASIDVFGTYEPTRHMLQAVMAEIAAVARARDVHIAADLVERNMQFVGTFPPGATTSMQRDLMNGLPSELEAQTGAVVRLGREARVATPINQFIYDSLILQERRARGAS